eukprot:1160531-Pelagomonas_calceolata.AAC.12
MCIISTLGTALPGISGVPYNLEFVQLQLKEIASTFADDNQADKVCPNAAAAWPNLCWPAAAPLCLSSTVPCVAFLYLQSREGLTYIFANCPINALLCWLAY